MHNCKQSRDELIEAALRGWIPDELAECPRCREEFESLRVAMQITDEAMQSIKPAQEFWPGYHNRLRQRLDAESQLPVPFVSTKAGPRWRRLFTASVPVPVPLAFAVFAVVVFALGFIWHTRAAGSIASPNPPSVITKTVEVPVVHEKVVTRVVYRERRNISGQLVRGSRSPQLEEDSQTAAGLAGFTPAHEPKLTIIKASYRDEK
jgi:anti-sigma factor RsiW